MKPLRPDWWSPEYQVQVGKVETKTYGVDIWTNECPVSIITPEIQYILALAETSRHEKDASGAAFCGMDCGKWPAWWADAVAVIEIQRKLAESSRFRVLQS